ncbi:extracellular solute-binding protein [Bdellovibrio svalbardensis]|uniref:Extracellular solute-binding protein n=1 Tax=Bdellovibrio svalbardensis TaxID=2972972 RepID=A0ABT6DM48_9BACT|nr:extracellular solute-binding protein [Bdellovibrio svalbardensis]MDG0817873.1 extracellular solute-binding protein [Bdellovibrio svalbardensis]
MRLLTLTALMIVSFQAAQADSIKWLGQFPKEQAQPVVELFNSEYAQEAGFTVEYSSSDADVNELLAGVDNKKADLVHLKDADLLNIVSVKGLTTDLNADTLTILPNHLRDTSNQWAGLLKRARIIYYNSDYVSAADVQTYESLGDAKFIDKLCLRQKKAQYTMSFNAFLLGSWGVEKTTRVLNAWAVNSETIPLIEKDLEGVIQTVESGNCWVGVANTYYFMRHLKAVPNTKIVAVMPNQNDIGAHVNVDGITILKSSGKQAQAQVFAKWLLSEKAQATLSQITDKFPANPKVISSSLQKTFGPFKENTTFDLSRITGLKAEALEIATDAGLQ